ARTAPSATGTAALPSPSPDAATTTPSSPGTTEPEAEAEPEPEPEPTRTTRAEARRDPPSEPESYTIESGDNLWIIARKLYDDGSRWRDIAQANPTVDPQNLKVGQKLRLPGAEPPSQADRRDTSDDGITGEGVRYKIAPGDTLSRIARRYYGDPGKWRVIYDANRQRIGSNPNTLQAGSPLLIPPAGNSAR
ncbi:MAG: LysM peptidoglycan-binding domain-containing protein, partial [Phycisphaeraceae bacterium]